jgi:hypothetical protein
MPDPRPAGVAAFVLLAVVSQGAWSQEYARARAEAVAETLPRLEALASWAESVKLLRERDRAYADILAVDPEHAAAREALQYRRETDGSWKQSAAYREPKNGIPAPLAEYAKRRSAAVAPFLDKVFAAIEAERNIAAPQDTRARIASLSRLAPDDPRVRQGLGETRVKDQWVLSETVSAIERRKALAKLAKACVDGLGKVEDATLTPLEEASGVKWTFKKQTSGVKIIAAAPAAEAERALRVTDATHRFLVQALAIEGNRWPNLTVVLFAKPEEGHVFVKAHPHAQEYVRADPEQFASAWIWKTSHLVAYYADEKIRLHNVSCRATGTSLSSIFNLVEEQGALYNGVIVYVTAMLSGIRLPSYGLSPDNTAAETAFHVRLHDDPKVDWLKLAVTTAQEKRASALEVLLGRPAHLLTGPDGLISWAFASYLFEARHESAAAFLRVAATAGAAKAAQDALGMPIPVLDQHFRRWVQETAQLGSK